MTEWQPKETLGISAPIKDRTRIIVTHEQHGGGAVITYYGDKWHFDQWDGYDWEGEYEYDFTHWQPWIPLSKTPTKEEVIL